MKNKILRVSNSACEVIICESGIIDSPFMNYADLESILVSEDNGKQNPEESLTNKYQKHLLVHINNIQKTLSLESLLSQT